jgi:hypothetical protein
MFYSGTIQFNIETFISPSLILLDEEMVFVVWIHCHRFKPSKSDRFPASINTREQQGNYRRSPWQHGASVCSRHFIPIRSFSSLPHHRARS